MTRSAISWRRWANLSVVTTLLLTGCGSFLGASEESYVSDEAAASGGSTTTLPPTTAPPPTTGPPAAPAGNQPALAAVSPASLATPQALEQRLADLRFDVTPDGKEDDNTRQALIAFQKLSGLPRTGKSDPAVINALASATLPPPMRPDGEPTRVEIDLGRQVLFLYTNGSLNKVLPVSTGTGKRYCDEGKCGIATTPKGSFRVERRISGWRKSDLGRLYNPLYFKGGIAIHGFPSVPPTPASHGCVRIPMGSANAFPGLVPDGTLVIVV